MIIKSPLPFLIAGIALAWPYPIAISILKYQMPKDFIGEGITAAIIFSSIPILIWWLILRVTSVDILYIKVLPNGNIKYKEDIKSWKYNITVGSFFSGFVGIIALATCWLFSWNLKTFAFITLLFPLLRIAYYYAWEKSFLIKHARGA